jgi:hypothetical protein
MIFLNSRYEYALLDYFALEQDADVHPVLFYPTPDIGTINYFEYAWVEGDRLDLVSQEFYQNPSFWWFILDKNPEIIDPNNITPGTILRIESLNV